MKLKERNILISTQGRWHAKLLEIATSENIITEELNAELKDYLGFRHFFRHNYGFMLDMELIRPLIKNIEKIIDELEAVLN